MIARLAGRIVEKEPHQVIIDIAGVGYRLRIPLSTFYSLPPVGGDVALRVHTHVKEDCLALYGFATKQEQVLFERLIEISGVGPRLSLVILSGLPAPDLIDVIAEGDAGRLRGIPGVGPKTADRVILEMRDRIRLLKTTMPAPEGAIGGQTGEIIRDDVISALVNLGYRERQAQEAVRQAQRGQADHLPGEAPAAGLLQELLKRSLRYLAS
ncbi:MAG: Holliday junction branch migration protein RuvA [Acidobacteriota bacterium]